MVSHLDYYGAFRVQRRLTTDPTHMIFNDQLTFISAMIRTGMPRALGIKLQEECNGFLFRSPRLIPPVYNLIRLVDHVDMHIGIINLNALGDPRHYINNHPMLYNMRIVFYEEISQQLVRISLIDNAMTLRGIDNKITSLGFEFLFDRSMSINSAVTNATLNSISGEVIFEIDAVRFDGILCGVLHIPQMRLSIPSIRCESKI